MKFERNVICAECGREFKAEFDLPNDLPEEVAKRIANPEHPYGQYAVCEECLNKRR